ncbi:MAG: T9SS type A sorting domain-containing protein, partial [Cyclobacteriaceae bacterium]|nr:T9SS type A sorting domain-containing protein [Cyclobacteriaceae bacterium]
LLIHTAKEAGQQPGPDYGFGWGLIDTEAAATFLLQKENEGKKLIERNLLSGEEHTLTLQPAANSKISVTLCWTDPEGNPVTPIIDPTQRMLVHDLDIRLIDDQGTVHFPWILNPTIPQAQATRGDNIRDNVEKIEVESAFKRTYTLSVRHKGNLNFGGQTYSLLISYIPALPAGKTLYRIGAGNWNDPARWSFTSGGAPANLVPGENDCAIIDNRSLQNNETLIATTNLNIKQCIIVSSKNATFNLNNNILSFSKNLTIAAPNWSITNGKLLANGGGLVTIAQGNLATSELIFENGNWECSGNLIANKVIVKTPLTLTNNVDWDLTTFETTSTSAITFGRSKISATIVNVQGTHQAADLILSAKHNATFSFNTIYFDGEVFIPNSNTCSITNASGLEKVFANGTLEIITNTFVKKLTVGKSASIKLSNQITLQVEEDFIVDNNAAISITSVGKANLKINTELMACLENATIANVDLLGNAAISLTGNATLTGATGWQTVGCADILQAKFSVEALCKTAWGRAVNLSIGNPESYLWTADFDAEFSSNEATPVINLPSTNNVTITLRVSKDTRSHQVSKTFTLTPNTLPENEILLADGRLISMQQAPVYTWLMNNEVLPQATERFLPISDFENKQFEVVIADGNCTRISKPFVITGIDFLTHNTLPYPNPTKGFFTITKTNEIINKQDWFLTNTEGRQFTFEITNTNTINVSHLPNGVYFFQNKRKKQTYRIVIMGH